jgi:hypothetical protein
MKSGRRLRKESEIFELSVFLRVSSICDFFRRLTDSVSTLSYGVVQQRRVPLDSSLRHQKIIADRPWAHELRPDQPGDSVGVKDVIQRKRG